jgi:hypothetical protein
MPSDVVRGRVRCPSEVPRIATGIAVPSCSKPGKPDPPKEPLPPPYRGITVTYSASNWDVACARLD